MREVTASGQTVDEAIRSALQQINLTRDEVQIEIIDEGKKGFLGIFGASRAVVKVSEKQILEEEKPLVNEPVVEETNTVKEKEEAVTSVVEELETKEEPRIDKSALIREARAYLTDVAKNMGAEVDVEVMEENNHITFTLTGDKLGILIGKRGRTLNSLQYLTQLVINKEGRKFQSVTVDAEGYRERRRETLYDLAHKMAEKALHIDKKVSLEPMPAYERKIIHSALQANDKVVTYSEGKEPHRYIVIKKA